MRGVTSEKQFEIIVTVIVVVALLAVVVAFVPSLLGLAKPPPPRI